MTIHTGQLELAGSSSRSAAERPFDAAGPDDGGGTGRRAVTAGDFGPTAAPHHGQETGVLAPAGTSKVCAQIAQVRLIAMISSLMPLLRQVNAPRDSCDSAEPSIAYALRFRLRFDEVPMRIRLMIVAALLLPAAATAGDVEDAVAAIKAVKREGAGNEAAAARWKEIVALGPSALPALLSAFDGADTTVANWLRTAAEAIAENEQKAGRPLPADQLETIVRDTKRSARGREFAFELLVQGDPAARKRLLPRMLNDPSGGLRREAVALALEDAKAPERLSELFAKARDVDQVERIAKNLKAARGDADVIGHLGLITRWQVAGPFDNSKLKGFSAPLPAKVDWKEFATAHERGLVDLYQALSKPRGVDPTTKKKDAVYALARTEIESPEERPVHIRAATPNAVRIWLNGREVFSRDEYHHGQKLDQHVGAAALKKGRNEILVKVCQDDATPDWTLTWAFQLRVCDEIGGAVPMTVLTAPNAVPVKPEPPKKEPAK
jgi:hypothetical protein